MANEYRLSYTANEINEKLGKIDELVQAKESLTAVQISALDGMFKIAAYTGDASAAYTAFKLAFGIEEPSEPDIPDVPDEPEVTLTRITATYSGGDVAVGTAVSALTGIVVTAHYSDGSTANVIGYTLNGTIVEGSNIIAVTYQGKTTTFAVTGVAGDSGEGTGVSNETTWTNGVAYTFEPIPNTYPDKSTGVIKDYANWERSPYLYCAGASTLRGVVKHQSSTLKGTNDNAFYDANKNYVAPVDGVGTFTFATLNNAAVGTYVDIPIPENAAYFIVSGGNRLFTGNDNSNNEPFIEYIPYGVSDDEPDVPVEPSEPIDTSPVIAQYDVGYNDKMVANARDGMCITQIYPYTPNIDAIKSGKHYDAENDYTTFNGEGGRIMAYTPSLKGRESGYSPSTTQASKVVRFIDGVAVDFHSNGCLTSSENPGEQQILFSRYKTDGMYANGVAFTLSTLDIDDSYAYWKIAGKDCCLPVGVEDGDIIFAGKNTKYYGMRNISQYTGE